MPTLETLEGDSSLYIPGSNMHGDELGAWWKALSLRRLAPALMPHLAVRRAIAQKIAPKIAKIAPKKILPPAKKTGIKKIVHRVNKAARTINQLQDFMPQQENLAVEDNFNYQQNSFPARRTIQRPVAIPEDDYMDDYCDNGKDSEFFGFDFLPSETLIAEPLNGDFGFSAIAASALPALKTAASGAATSAIQNAFRPRRRRRRRINPAFLYALTARKNQPSSNISAPVNFRAGSPVNVRNLEQIPPAPVENKNTAKQEWYKNPVVIAGAAVAGLLLMKNSKR